MKKISIILGCLIVVLTFSVSGFSEGVKTRKISSASQIEGRWTGTYKYKDNEKLNPAKAVFFVEGTRMVGFFTAWNNEQLTCSGYIDADSGKAIIKTWYDDRAHNRMELKLSQDGSRLIGGTYEFADKNQDIELTKEK